MKLNKKGVLIVGSTGVIIALTLIGVTIGEYHRQKGEWGVLNGVPGTKNTGSFKNGNVVEVLGPNWKI